MCVCAFEAGEGGEWVDGEGMVGAGRDEDMPVKSKWHRGTQGEVLDPRDLSV